MALPDWLEKQVQRVTGKRQQNITYKTHGKDLITVYRGLSDIHHEKIMREGFYPSHGQDKVYTATKFYEAARFSWGHISQEGGNAIVYQLKVPIDRFHSQIYYLIDGWKRMGYLTSGHLEPELIEEAIKLPVFSDIYESGYREYDELELKKEQEEQERETNLKTFLAKIPVERIAE